MKTSVIIVAAGMGSRMKAGINKQFLVLRNEPILTHTLRVFEKHQSIDEIILVLKEDEIDYVRESIIEANGLVKISRIAIGGEERADSVQNGLNLIRHNGIVLIHDGARPFVTKEEISNVIETAALKGAAVVGTPATNTMKMVDSNGMVTHTLDRSSIWNISTPQGFRVPLIKRGFEMKGKALQKVWDDAMLIELLGEPVSVIRGSYENIKITTPTDMIIGESIFKERDQN